MKKLVLTVAVLASAAVPAMASDRSQVMSCMNRIMNSCGYSQESRLSQAVECKQVRPGLDVALLASGKLIEFRGCDGQKFSFDYSGVQEIKMGAGMLFMLAREGHVYYLDPNDDGIYEVLNGSRQPYSSVTELKGTQGGQGIFLIHNNGSQPQFLDAYELQVKRSKLEVIFITRASHVDNLRDLFD